MDPGVAACPVLTLSLCGRASPLPALCVQKHTAVRAAPQRPLWPLRNFTFRTVCNLSAELSRTAALKSNHTSSKDLNTQLAYVSQAHCLWNTVTEEESEAIKPCLGHLYHSVCSNTSTQQSTRRVLLFSVIECCLLALTAITSFKNVLLAYIIYT